MMMQECIAEIVEMTGPFLRLIVYTTVQEE